jgi:hypothetical protein
MPKVVVFPAAVLDQLLLLVISRTGTLLVVVVLFPN